MNKQTTAQSASRENNRLKALEARLKNNEVETNVPFNSKELQEHSEKNPGRWKLEHELPNRRQRRTKELPAIKQRAITEPVTGTKLQKRQCALELLQAQLKRGTKPAKEAVYGWENKRWRIKTKVGDASPLSSEDTVRIETQIANLERKIKGGIYQLNVKAGWDCLPTTEDRSTPTQVPGKKKEHRASHPNTKIHKFIQGVYQKISK